MAYKDEKIVEILLSEVKNAESRCPEYHEELTEVLADIVQKERSNLFQKTDIVVQIGDLISTVGKFIELKNSNSGPNT